MVMDESDRNKLFIGGLSFASTEEGLRACFIRFGRLKRVQIPHSRDDPGRSKGFGFVTFEDERDMLAAMAQDNMELDGRVLSISRATSSESFTKRQVSAADAAAARPSEGTGRVLSERPTTAGSFGIHFTNLPPPFTWRELKDLLRRGGAEDVLHTSVTQPGIGLGEVGSDAERRRVVKTLDGTMVDRFKITVFAAERDGGDHSRQPRVRHSGAVREVIPSRDTRDQNQGQRSGARNDYEAPLVHRSGSNNANGSVMRPQEGASRKRGPEADPPGHEGYLVSRAANNAPPHLVASYATREEARSTAARRGAVPEYRDEGKNFSGTDTYREAVPVRREAPVYDQQPIRESNGYPHSRASAHERPSYQPPVRDDFDGIPVSMQQSAPPPLYNSNTYSQPTLYVDPPAGEMHQQQGYGGGAREAQRDHVRFEDVLPSRNGGGGDAYLQTRESHAPQGGGRYNDDRYIASERINPSVQHENGAHTVYAPSRDLPPPLLQQQERPPLYEPRERIYQAPVTAPPPMSGYLMSSIDSLQPAQRSSRGYEQADARDAAPVYESGPRQGGSLQYSDNHGPSAAAPSRSVAYEPMLGPQGGSTHGRDNKGVPAVSGYAPREDVRQSGYMDDYQRGGRVPIYEPAPAIYDRASPPVVYASARLPMLDRGMNEDGRGPARESYRDSTRQSVQEPERQYLREPAREYVPQQQPTRPMQPQIERHQEPERRSARELAQLGGSREPARQQQGMPEQPRQPPPGPYHNGSGPPMQQKLGNFSGSRGPVQQGNDRRGLEGRDHGHGGPARGSKGRPMPY